MADIAIPNVSVLNHYLQALEEIPKPTNINPNTVLSVRESPSTKAFNLKVTEWLGRINHFQPLMHAAEQETQEDWTLFQQQRIAFLYGTKQAQKAPNVDETLLGQFQILLANYRSNKKIFPAAKSIWSDQELEIFRKACQYPEFVQALLDRQASFGTKDPWVEKFLMFCLRDRLSVDVFVELPNEANQLIKNYISSRIGSIDPDFVQLINRSGKRVLTMKIDGKDVEIQGNANKAKTIKIANRLENGAYAALPKTSITVDQIYRQFREKNHSYGTVEVTKDFGVRLWHTMDLCTKTDSTTTYLDVTQLGWEQRLPKVATLTLDQLQERYPGQTVCENGQYGLVIKATRQHEGRSLLQNHGFFELVIPDQENPETFHICSMGFQPKDLPSSLWDLFFLLGATRLAGVHTADDSSYVRNRTAESLFLALTDTESTNVLNYLATQIQKGRDGKLYFQPTGENCAFFVQKLYDETLARDFYEGLKNYYVEACSCDPTEAQDQIDQVCRGLDTDALNALAEKISNHFIAQNDHAKAKAILDLCLKPINRLSGEEFAIPTDLGVIERDTLKESLKQLIVFSVTLQQFYKVSLAETTTDTVILKQMLAVVRCIPWKTLQAWLLRVFLFIFFFSWRGFSFSETGENGQEIHHVARSLSSPLAKTGQINLPAMLFEWRENFKEGKFSEQANLIINRLNQPILG